MATTTTRSLTRPAKDEWGVYDPQQAGLAALYARLDMNEKTTPAVPAVIKPAEKLEAAAPRPTLRDAK